MMRSMASSDTSISFSGTPLAAHCLGRRYLRAMCSFSSYVYPDSSMTSILSSRGGSMLSTVFAVVMNMTLERSKGSSR